MMKILATAALALSFGSPANAVTWTINNAIFADGSVLTGSFDWDPTSHHVTSWSFSVTAGAGPWVEETYSETETDHEYSWTDSDPYGLTIYFFSDSFYDADPLPRRRDLRIGGASLDLSDLATPVAVLPLISGSNPSVLGGFQECFNCSPYRAGTDKAWLSADVAPVPVPASLPLLAFGIGGLGLMARRKRKAA